MRPQDPRPQAAIKPLLRDFWITVSPGVNLRAMLNPWHAPDRPKQPLLRRRYQRSPLAGALKSAGVVHIRPVFGTELLESYEQRALGVPVTNTRGNRIKNITTTLVRDLLPHLDRARIAEVIRLLRRRDSLAALDVFRDELPMFHPYYLVRQVVNEETPDLAAVLRDQGEVAHISEAPRLVRDAFTPADPLLNYPDPTFGGTSIQMYPADWRPTLRQQWSLARINALEAWKHLEGQGRDPTAAGVVVAIIDSGIQYSHPDLRGSEHRHSDRCILNEPRPQQPPDAHGTLVAGIIGARSNKRGICGIAAGATLLSKVHGGKQILTTAPPPDPLDITDRIAAIVTAVRLGAGVINLSWHAERTCCRNDVFFKTKIHDPMLEALMFAAQHRVPVVCSAGNDSHLNHPTPYISYPAALDGFPYKQTRLQVISVGGLDPENQRYPSSNYAVPTPHAAQWPLLMAPGYAVPSTDLTGTDGRSRGRYDAAAGVHDETGWEAGYAPFGGTSAATAHVTGVIALMLEKFGARRLPVSDIKARLASTATPLGPQVQYGAGLVDALKALQ